jgi:hypothetical protein
VLARIRRKTRRKRLNAVVDSTVDMAADVEAINRGEAIRSGERWTVHQRTYHVDAMGHAWPVSGAGVYVLNRAAFLALGIYNEYGLSDVAESLLDLEQVSEVARTEAREVWRAGRSVV